MNSALVSPRVSVVIPNYNHAQFLDLRMETVLNQTFSDFEVIFLDDGSTDNSLEVFAKYAADPRVRALQSPDNSGSPFKQWNQGVALASGEYVWIAESDDYSDLKFLEKMVETLDSNPTAGMAYSQSWFVAEDNTPMRVFDWYDQFRDRERWDEDYCNSGQDEVAAYLSITNTIPNASAVLIRKGAIREKPFAPESMRLAGDWMVWVKLLRDADVCFKAEPLNYFRVVHEGSQRGRSDIDGLMVLEGLEVYRYIRTNFELTTKQQIRSMYRHLRTWGRIANRDQLSADINRQVLAGFVDISRKGSSPSRVQRCLPYIFYYLLIPFRKSPLYRHTIDLLRKRKP